MASDRSAAGGRRSHTASFTATVTWRRDEGEAFVDNRYGRGHLWRFDGGIEVPASSAPSSVPLPLSRADAVDPEEALVAATSSCHMLFFLAFAAREKLCVDLYDDAATGTLARRDDGRIAMTEIRLRPRVVFSGQNRPDADLIARLHHEAHEACYIANSITAQVVVETVAPEFA